MSYRVGRVIGSRGSAFRAQATSKPDSLRDKSGIDVGARRNYDHEQAAVKKAEDDKKKREDLIKQRNQEAERRMKDTMREEMDSKGTEARVKIKNVSRPDDPEPTSADSKLSKTGQIKTKIIDEEKPLMSDKTLGLPSGLIAAARAVMERKHDTDDVASRKLTGGKTKVDLRPETDDDLRDDSEKKMKKTVKEATHPKTEKEKKLAALAHPKDKITHKDVLVGRGVLAKEEVELDEEMTIDKLKKQGFKKVSSSNNGWTHHYAHPDKEHGYKIEYGPQPDTIKSIKKTKSIYEEVDLDALTEEELEEVLKKSQPAGEWIKDFVHSKDPKFAGKSKKKRMQMALGAYYAKQRNEEVEMDEATKSASYNALMADPLKNRLERLKQKEKSMAPGISAERKKLAIEKDKIQKQLANKQRNEEVDIEEAAKKSSVPVVTKKIDFDKVKQVRDARKAAKQARLNSKSKKVR